MQVKQIFKVASNDQKTVLPSLRPLTTASPRDRGSGQLPERVEATIIVSGDVANENAQIVVTQLPKASSTNKSKTLQQVSKTVSPQSVSQSTSGAMTGEFSFYLPTGNEMENWGIFLKNIFERKFLRTDKLPEERRYITVVI